MLNGIKELIRSWASLPLWAYGLHCNRCQMSFTSADEHYAHVKNNKDDLDRHKNRIPTLR